MTAADAFAPAALRAAPDELFHGAHVRALPNPLALPVLALDFGSNMGYAYRTAACVTSGTMNWALKRNESEGQRLLRIWRWLHRIHDATPLSLVAYELVQHMGPQQRLAALAFARYQGLVEMFAARAGVPTKSVPVLTLKKAITGTGKHPKGTSKEAMMAAVMGNGYAPTTYDEADALGVLIWATR